MQQSSAETLDPGKRAWPSLIEQGNARILQMHSTYHSLDQYDIKACRKQFPKLSTGEMDMQLGGGLKASCMQADCGYISAAASQNRFPLWPLTRSCGSR